MGNLAPLSYLFLLALFGVCEGQSENKTVGQSENKTVTFAELEKLNATQKANIAELKTAMSSVPHEWMKEDIYLMRFLQATSFKVPQAKKMMNDMIKWRKDKNVDKWENDTKLNAMEIDYPSDENGFDKQGRPLRQAPYGKWDNVEATKKPLPINEYAIRAMERCQTKIREQQAKGLDVTQFTILFNFEGFGVTQTLGCTQCMTLFKNFIKAYEDNYPNSMKEVILVNTPPTFGTFYSVISKTMKPSSAALVTIFKMDKKEWKPYIADRAASDQLTVWFDGTKPTKSPNGGGKGGLLGG